MVCIAVILYSNGLLDCNDFIDLIFNLSGHSVLIHSAYPCLLPFTMDALEEQMT